MMTIRPVRAFFWGLVLWGGFLIGVAAPAQAQQPEPLPLGSEMPSVTVQRMDGSAVSLASLAGEQGTVVIFWSNQCPWVSRYTGRVEQLVSAFQPRGFQFVLVNANDASAFPQESLEASRQQNVPGVYVKDPGSTLARALGASRTPHVFVFDANETLVYTGAIDDSPGDPGNVQTPYLENVLTALAQSNAVPVSKTKAFGCMIKFANP